MIKCLCGGGTMFPGSLAPEQMAALKQIQLPGLLG